VLDHDFFVYTGGKQCFSLPCGRTNSPKQVCVGRPAYSNCCCLTARGRLLFSAHKRVVVFCWPKRASSWNQMSTLSKAICPGIKLIVSICSFFKVFLSFFWLLRVLRTAGDPRKSQPM
jgi:hypothetical protein